MLASSAFPVAFGRVKLDYCIKAGVDMAGKPLVFGIRDVEVTTQLMQLRAEKADYIYENGLLIDMDTKYPYGYFVLI